MHKLVKLTIGVAGVLALGAGPAIADIQPGPADVVGVGSDTVQNIMNFIADGDTTGDPGVNVGLKNRVFSFDATPDANDRAGYLNGSTNPNLKPLTPTIVLRRGTVPVQRPNGSGAGISALLADTTKPYKIDYVRSSRPPKAAEQTTAGTDGFGASNAGLRVVKISDDALGMAVNGQTTLNSNGTYTSTFNTNAPSALSKEELKDIYSCFTASNNPDGYDATHWNTLPGNSTGSTDAIVPLIPQTGSGTRSTFLSDIGVTTPGGCVQTVEENDPTSITGNATPMDAIAPFSGGRIDLYANGYFHNPATVFPGAAASLTPGVALLNGATAGDSADNYVDNRGLYIIFRANDATLATKFQSGGTQNWANTLFIGSAPFVNSSNGQADIIAGGATPDYVDEGNGFSNG